MFDGKKTVCVYFRGKNNRTYDAIDDDTDLTRINNLKGKKDQRKLQD